jgi:hypothetical protein
MKDYGEHVENLEFAEKVTWCIIFQMKEARHGVNDDLETDTPRNEMDKYFREMGLGRGLSTFPHSCSPSLTLLVSL